MTDYDGPHRTDTQRLGDDIAGAAKRIRKALPDMLPSEAPGRRIKSSHGTPPGILATHGPADRLDHYGRPSWSADHVAAEGDIDILTRLVSLRAFVVTRLNGWCRLIMEDRPIRNAATLPDGTDPEAMCLFLERHADWLSGHEAAGLALEELTDDAKACERWTDPYRKEWHVLGPCPFIVDCDDAAERFCRGIVRVRIADETNEASCSDCGREAVVEWWEEVLGSKRTTVLTPAEASATLASRLGIEVNERTVRRWASTYRIRQVEVFGPQPKNPRYWFNERDLLEDVAHMDRECVLCGTIHSSTHPLCLRCLSATWRNTPRYADERPLVGTGTTSRVVRRISPTPEGTRRLVEQLDQWCSFGELPKAWCACGRHAV